MSREPRGLYQPEDCQRSFRRAVQAGKAATPHRVQSGEENFSAGDILVVSLRKRQWLEADVMKAEHEVIEVLSHRRGMAQIPLVFTGDEFDES